jgi:ferritin-like metal-binding protein YciE
MEGKPSPSDDVPNIAIGKTRDEFSFCPDDCVSMIGNLGRPKYRSTSDWQRFAARNSRLPDPLPKGTAIGKDYFMGLFSKDIKTFDDLFLHTLQDIYYAENEILKALPTMVDRATDPQLKSGFETHFKETQGQVKRLEQVFAAIGQQPKAVTCPAINGILKEANEVAGEVQDKRVLDAALIAAAQAVEHYEITRYGTLISWAQLLGRNDCAALLQQTLKEESATDKKLSSLAENSLNRKAA